MDRERELLGGEFSSVEFSSVEFSSVEFSSVEFSSVEFSSVEFSSVEFSSVEFSSVEFSGADVIAIDGSDAFCLLIVEAVRARATTPILIFRSTRGSEGAVALLDAGADCCLPVDCARKERDAVLRAMLRRRALQLNTEDARVIVDDSARTLWLCGEPFRFGPVGFSVVRYLVKNRDHWVTQRQIVEVAIETNYRPDSAVARVQIHQIRKTLGDYRWCIKQNGNRGCGYMFSLSKTIPSNHESGTFAAASPANAKSKEMGRNDG